MNAAAIHRVTLHARDAAPPAKWTRERLAGRLTEVSAWDGASPLTLAVALVLDAQRHGETTAWVGRTGSSFFPPDVAAAGVDLDALVVVRVPSAGAVARCADRLLRSGALGLVVLDLGRTHRLPPAVQSRLASLAKRHDAALLCLTRKRPDSASMGPLVSIRAQARRTRLKGGRYACEAMVLKDKGRAAGWNHAEECRGPPGLC